MIAEEVIAELSVRSGKLEAELRNSAQRVDRSLGQMQRRGEDFNRNFSNSLRGAAGVLAASFSVGAVKNMADGYTRFTNQLKVAGVEAGNLSRTQERLFQISQKYGTELEATGTLFSRASQAAKDLGASEAQLFQFTEGVSAALKVQGGSAQDAAGALLQLSQALGGGIVRAEEFNSIMEGARPIAVAVAQNIDRFGGSVSKLRAAVADGKVTSQEFFQAFLQGTAQLEKQASASTLTIAASFTVLNNALGKYIGEADKSLSATERVSAAIVSLSNNLSVVAPVVGALVTLIGVRYVAALSSATAATLAKTVADVRATASANALAAANARLAPFMLSAGTAASGAAVGVTAFGTAAGVAAAAGRGLLALVGGPIGAALVALTATFYAVSLANDEATSASKKYRDALASTEKSSATIAQALEKLATATGKARDEQLAYVNSLKRAQQEELKSAQTALALARVRAVAAAAALKNQPTGLVTEGGLGAVAGATAFAGRNASKAEADAKAAEEAVKKIEDSLKSIEKAVNAPAFSPAAAATKDKKKKKASGPTAEEIEAQFAGDLASANAEILSLKKDMTADYTEQLALTEKLLEVEKARIDGEINAEKNYSRAQKDVLLAKNAEIFEIRKGIARRQEDIQADREEADIRLQMMDAQRSELELALELAGSTAERKRIAQQLLDLQYERLRQEQRDIINSRDSTPGQVNAAQRRLESIDRQQTGAQAGLDREYEGPLEKYKREINRTTADMDRELEQVQVDGIKSLGDALTDTTARMIKMGGVFGDVANGIIRDLIRIAVQQQVIAPLLNAIGGLTETPVGTPPIVASGTKLGNIPKFANGGSLILGGNGGRDNNMLSLNGAPLAMVSAGERMTISPQGGGGAGGVTVHVSQANNFAGGAATQEDVARMAQVTKEATMNAVFDSLGRRGR